MEAQNNLKDRLSSFGLKRSVGRDGHPWDLNDLMRVKKRTSEKSLFFGEMPIARSFSPFVILGDFEISRQKTLWIQLKLKYFSGFHGPHREHRALPGRPQKGTAALPMR